MHVLIIRTCLILLSLNVHFLLKVFPYTVADILQKMCLFANQLNFSQILHAMDTTHNAEC